MSYCTTTDVVNATGTVYATATIQALIDMADAEIDARLQAMRVTGSGSALKAASLNLSISKLYTRMRMDGSKTASTSIDGTIQLGENIDQAIATYERKARKLLDDYIAAAAPRKKYYVARSDR